MVGERGSSLSGGQRARIGYITIITTVFKNRKIIFYEN